MRPFGASLSMGITSITIDPAGTRSPSIFGSSMNSAGAFSSSVWRRSSTPLRLAACMHTAGTLRSASGMALRQEASTESPWFGMAAVLQHMPWSVVCSVLLLAGSPSRSVLLNTMMKGMLRAFSWATMPSSYSPQMPACVTTTPKSQRSNTFAVRWERSWPTTAWSSSMPAVSMSRMGPSGSSSIGLSTGSVVVPGTSETMLTCWLVREFSTLDFPTLRLPNRPIPMRIPLGARMSAGPLSCRLAVCWWFCSALALPVSSMVWFVGPMYPPVVRFGCDVIEAWYFSSVSMIPLYCFGLPKKALPFAGGKGLFRHGGRV